jgi:uncharacterized membrane protein YkoI
VIIAGPVWLAAAALTTCLAFSLRVPATEAASITEVASNTEAASIHEISREQAMQVLQQRYGGAARVVRTDVIEKGGRHVYVFRLLSVNGKVWIVHIDAQSGAEVP